MRFALMLCACALAACNKGEAPPTEAAPRGPSPAPAQQARMVKPGGGAAAPIGLPGPGSQPVVPMGNGLPEGHPALPEGHPAVAPGDQPMAAGSQPMAAGSQPMAAGSQPMAAPGEGAVAAGGTLKGTLDVKPELKAAVKAGAVLFLIVRRDEGEGQRGTMLAAKKVPVTGPDMFPYAFEVGPGDVMMQGSQLSGAVRIEARVDGDGDALSKLPGDIAGGPLATEVGKTGVDFFLETSL